LPAANHLERLQVVLVDTRNPLNMGAAARAMSNFGFGHLRLVSPFQPACREARSAVGPASELLTNATEYKTIAEAVEDCTLVVGTTGGRKRELHHPLRRLEEGTRLIRKHLHSGKVALLFGSEKRGLLNDQLSHCDWLIRIATREEHLSMNLGQAVAVCLYEIVRGRRVTAEKISKRANARQMEQITQLMFQALNESGYVNPRTSRSTEEKLRRMVRRLNVPAADAEIWFGMLRQLLWKLRANGS
jgi:TrmH family RNA methyltransferase